MKKLLLPLLLSTSLSTFAADLDFWFDSFCYKSPKVQIRSGVFYLPNQQTPVTAENLCVYESNGQYHSQGNILNGLKDGKWTWWYENGEKEKEETYIKGEIEKEKEETYIFGVEFVKTGENTEIRYSYYENGQIREEGNYKDGKEHGKYTSWYENGQIMVESNLKDGKIDGKRTVWYENGQKAYEWNFKDGDVVGKYIEWYENGQIKEEGIW